MCDTVDKNCCCWCFLHVCCHFVVFIVVYLNVCFFFFFFFFVLSFFIYGNWVYVNNRNKYIIIINESKEKKIWTKTFLFDCLSYWLASLFFLIIAPISFPSFCIYVLHDDEWSFTIPFFFPQQARTVSHTEPCSRRKNFSRFFFLFIYIYSFSLSLKKVTFLCVS